MMIEFRLKELLNERNITRYSLKKDTRLADSIVNGMYKNTSKRVEIKTLEQICEAIDCEPSDLFKYIKNKKGE